MQTTLKQNISSIYSHTTTNTSLWNKFIAWCGAQEKDRLLWVALILAAHGSAVTPITVMVTLFTGANLYLFMASMVAKGLALFTNLAAMPTKVTIPAFFSSLLIAIAILTACEYMALS